MVILHHQENSLSQSWQLCLDPIKVFCQMMAQKFCWWNFVYMILVLNFYGSKCTIKVEFFVFWISPKKQSNFELQYATIFYSYKFKKGLSMVFTDCFSWAAQSRDTTSILYIYWCLPENKILGNWCHPALPATATLRSVHTELNIEMVCGAV